MDNETVTRVTKNRNLMRHVEDEPRGTRGVTVPCVGSWLCRYTAESLQRNESLTLNI